MNMDAVAQAVDMFVESRFKPYFAQRAACEPLGGKAAHFGDDRAGVDVGCAENFQGPRGAASFRQSRALQHHGPCIGARHVDIGRIGARVDPEPVGWPAKAGGSIGVIPLHRHNMIIDINFIMIDKPPAQFAQGQAVAHRNRPCTDETFPSGQKRQALNRPSRRIGAVENPDRFAMLGGSLQHIKQRRYEGIDATAQILHVDQYDIERAH